MPTTVSAASSAMAVAGWADSVAPFDPAAITLGAIAESDAIAAFSTFATMPLLSGFTDRYATEIAAARAEVEGLEYGEAVELLLATFDRALAEHT